MPEIKLAILSDEAIPIAKMNKGNDAVEIIMSNWDRSYNLLRSEMLYLYNMGAYLNADLNNLLEKAYYSLTDLPYKIELEQIRPSLRE